MLARVPADSDAGQSLFREALPRLGSSDPGPKLPGSRYCPRLSPCREYPRGIKRPRNSRTATRRSASLARPGSPDQEIDTSPRSWPARVVRASRYPMGSTGKTRAELQSDLEILRDRLEEVERAEVERARALNALRESEDRYRALFEQAARGRRPDRDGNRAIPQSQREVLRHRGIRRGRAARDGLSEHCSSGRSREGSRPRRQLLAGEISAYQTEKRYVHKQGHPVWIQLNASLLRDANGKPVRSGHPDSGRDRSQAGRDACEARGQGRCRVSHGGSSRPRVRGLPDRHPVRSHRVCAHRGRGANGTGRLCAVDQLRGRDPRRLLGPTGGQQSPDHPRGEASADPERPRTLPAGAPRLRLHSSGGGRGNALELHVPPDRHGQARRIPLLLQYQASHLLRSARGDLPPHR